MQTQQRVRAIRLRNPDQVVSVNEGRYQADVGRKKRNDQCGRSGKYLKLSRDKRFKKEGSVFSTSGGKERTICNLHRARRGFLPESLHSYSLLSFFKQLHVGSGSAI